MEKHMEQNMDSETEPGFREGVAWGSTRGLGAGGLTVANFVFITKRSFIVSSPFVCVRFWVIIPASKP